MVSIVTKKIKGKIYLYLVHSKREKNKVKQKTIKYIGKKRPISKHEFACMQYSYEKKDWILKEHKDELSYQDHALLKKASDQQKQHLSTLDKISRCKEQENFLAQFIANSNAIEGSTLTNRETYNYLFKDVTPPGHKKKELHMAENLLKAWRYVEEHHTRFPSETDLKVLHKLTNRSIESDETLGKYKKIQNYIGDIYTTSFLFVKERMQELRRWMKKGFKEMNDFEVAFQSHAQFELIHPFVDGNGRVGRLLINWLLLHKKLQPLAIQVKKRDAYLSALHNAQRGKIEAIVKFCCDEYKEQYTFVSLTRLEC